MSNIDPEAFGNAMGELIRKRFEEESHHVDERLKRLESKIEKCMTYAGEFQSALDYKAGTLVRHHGRLLVATKDVKAGASGGTREGAGWEKVFDVRDRSEPL